MGPVSLYRPHPPLRRSPFPKWKVRGFPVRVYAHLNGSIVEGGKPSSNRYKTKGNASAESVAPIQIAGQTVKKWRKDQTLYYRVLVDAKGSMTLDIVFPGTG